MATMEIDQQMELLKRSVPILPTQLRRYTGVAFPPDPPRRDYYVQAMQNDLAKREVVGDWEQSIHPSGATYYYNARRKTYTGMNMRACSDEQLQRLESWVQLSRTKMNREDWPLVVEPTPARGVELYRYYYVVPENQVITWIEPMDGYILFQECTMASQWDHKRLELEAQYWKHVEYFPCRIEMQLSEVRDLRSELNSYCVEAVTLKKSTARAMFWTLKQMKEITAELATTGMQLDLNLHLQVDDQRTEELVGPEGVVGELGVAICGKLLYILRHHQYLIHYGQPEAHLMRTHSLSERCKNNKSPFLTGFIDWIPTIKRLKDIYGDGLVSGVDMNEFLDDFIAQAKPQTTLATIIMAVNSIILRIPGLGSTTATKTLCCISIILSLFCIVAWMMAQCFGHKMRSRDFAVYYLQKKRVSLVINVVAPGLLYRTSLTFSILGFLAGVFAGGFELPLSAKIGFGLIVVVGILGLILQVTFASLGPLGPGLIRREE